MNYKNKSCINVSITLHGDLFDTNYVTKRSGIVPSYIRQKNEKLNNGRLFDHTEWGIETGWVENKDLEEILEMILPTIRDKCFTFKEIAKECGANWDLLIGLKIWNEVKPDLYFSKENIKLFADLGMEVGIDYYCYGFEDSDEHIH
jgi:hypothetical protein